jgi:two-component system sensor histidine kinase DesK
VKRLAAEQERLRIARDLHDLLGHALTSVIVKSDLATRLALKEPERAKAEMAEVAALARQGLADVRSTVAGYREVTLVTELATARSVLRSAGISADLPGAVESVPLELRETFVWVLREAITNVVRHSRAQHVSVRLEPRALEVVDDGIGPGGVGDRYGAQRPGGARRRRGRARP